MTYIEDSLAAEATGQKLGEPHRSQTHIESFLRLGYFVDYPAVRCPIDFSRIDKSRYGSATDEDLIRAGIDSLQATFAELWQPGKDDVVPISGGLDSRLILAMLLEFKPADQILTYTFGVPGSYDYEIGSRIAREIGTRHSSFPMNGLSWHRDELLEVAEREDCQAVLFYNQPLRHIRSMFGGGLFWSGYVGDAVAGSHLQRDPSPSLEDAKRRYLRRRRLVKSVQLWRASDDEFLPYIAGGRLPPDVLSWDEQVLFDEGASKFTVPHVLWKGFRYRTPLINSPWMDFMFSAPDSHRLEQRLMISIARRAFPILFGLPSKNRLGHTFEAPDAVVRGTFWFNRVRKLVHQFVPSVNWPNSQYNDFDEEIRTSRDLRDIVRGSIEALRRRGICDWVDFDGIWQRHDRRLRNHGDALVTLASLELVMEARERNKAGGAAE